MSHSPLEIAGYWVAVNLLAFFLYGFDKRAALNGAARVSEAVLLIMVILGGYAGAWLAMQKFRHKTQKLSFKLRFVIALILHFAGIWYLTRSGGAP